MRAGRHVTALILSGGGARAAYQVGALRALAELSPRGSPLPFPVLCGTSAGAINAVTLAIHADDFRLGVARLTRWWRRVRYEDVYRADFRSISRHGMRWLAGVLTGRPAPAEAASMLDNEPLARFLGDAIDFGRLDAQIASGALHAIAVNATSYSSGFAITFFQGADALRPWRRTRREGRRDRLGLGHLLASTAIPFVFPAAPLGGDWYMDGSVRQLTPLSPALHLGARRLLVLSVGQFAGQQVKPAGLPSYPSFAQTAGHALSSIFLDNLAADLERLDHINRVAGAVRDDVLASHGIDLGHVDAFVLSPSRDLGESAMDHAGRLPGGVRALLRGLGSTQGTGANLTSYLLFDPVFVRMMLDLGYADAMARREELRAFLGGSWPRPETGGGPAGA